MMAHFGLERTCGANSRALSYNVLGNNAQKELVEQGSYSLVAETFEPSARTEMHQNRLCRALHATQPLELTRLLY